MTQLEFNATCHKRFIAPAVALESEAIRTALKERNDREVIRLLDEEF